MPGKVCCWDSGAIPHPSPASRVEPSGAAIVTLRNEKRRDKTVAPFLIQYRGIYGQAAS